MCGVLGAALDDPGPDVACAPCTLTVGIQRPSGERFSSGLIRQHRHDERSQVLSREGTTVPRGEPTRIAGLARREHRKRRSSDLSSSSEAQPLKAILLNLSLGSRYQ